MEQDLEADLQDESESVMAAASGALREILDKIDSQNTVQPKATSSACAIGESVAEAESCQARDIDAEKEPSKKETSIHASNVTEVESLSLPHEGERWVRLRNQVIKSPLFKKYLRLTEEDSSWSINEAFASFCLDRIEESLAPLAPKPTKPAQVKVGTRRKGQPKKYERRQSSPVDDHQAPRPLRKRKVLDNSLTEEDIDKASPLKDKEDKGEDDLLAMEDNPDDLDYQPVPIIRYPKRRKSVPRTINSSIVTVPKPPARPKKTAKSTVEPPKKKPPPPKKVQIPKYPKKEPSLEPFVPPRKRGRPRKVGNEVQKKVPKPRVKTEKPAKSAKQYIRMEVRLQRLPKMYECKTCFEQFPEAEDVRKHFLGVHHPDRRPLRNLEPGEGLIGNADRGGPDVGSMLMLFPDITNLANLLRQCPKCKKFVGNMTVHRREHRERNFICEECGKGFTENQILQKHKKVHEMDRTGDRYKCDLCDKSYRFSQNLRSHMMYHGGEKTFICDYCGKSFYTNNRLIIHSAIHMKEKPFKCSECGRGFSQKSNMQKHERVHTGVKPYQCDLCMESFNHKVSLKNHKKKHHGIDWWKEAGKLKPTPTKKPKDATQGVIVNREEQMAGLAKRNTLVHLDKEQPGLENQWKGGDVPLQRENNSSNHWNDDGHDRQPGRELEATESPWHRQDSDISIGQQQQQQQQQQNQAAEEAVRLQTLHQAGNQWKGNNIPMDRQGQAGDQGMTTFFYPPAYLQGYPSGYSGMPVIPINTDSSILPSTRPTY